jgi:hypothetical protein
MKIRVYRLSGDLEYHEIIVDDLCTTTSVGKNKGMCFLYDNLSKLVYEMDVRYSGLLNPNDVVLIDDNSIGESFYGRVTSISINGQMTNNESLDISYRITVERYLENDWDR